MQIHAEFGIMVPMQFVFLVHEPPYKKCSERQALQEAFRLSELKPKVPVKLNELSVLRANQQTTKSIGIAAAWSLYAPSLLEMPCWTVLDAAQRPLFIAHSWTEMAVKCSANGLEMPSHVKLLA